eukprot:3143014-Alexandrium_andersonii.AAC.1
MIEATSARNASAASITSVGLVALEHSWFTNSEAQRSEHRPKHNPKHTKHAHHPSEHSQNTVK